MNWDALSVAGPAFLESSKGWLDAGGSIPGRMFKHIDLAFPNGKCLFESTDRGVGDFKCCLELQSERELIGKLLRDRSCRAGLFRCLRLQRRDLGQCCGQFLSGLLKLAIERRECLLCRQSLRCFRADTRLQYHQAANGCFPLGGK